MKYHRNNNVYTFLLIITFGFTFGQNAEPPKEIKSPIASSLGRFGDIPINYYTGRANVNIPLFSDEENRVPLNMSLNYDTGGVHVNDMPSWIGQNWNMEAGGVITRKQNGPIDEMKYTGNPQPNFNLGYYYTCNTLNNNSWSTQSSLNTLISNNNIDKKDFEPDIFNFNFMGYSGKFFLAQDGEWKVQSTSNIKVDINMAENQNTLNRDIYYPARYGNNFQGDPRKTIFKISLTDDKGVKYIFGNNHNAIEYCQGNFFNYKQGVVPNAWFLTSVTDRLGNVLYNFAYERGEYQASFYLNWSSKSFRKSSNEQIFVPGAPCYGSDSQTLMAQGSLIAPSYLKTITTRNGYVINFNRSVSPYRCYHINTESMINYTITNYYEPSGGVNPDLYVYDLYYLLYHDNNEQTILGTGPYKQVIFNDKLKNYKLDNITVSNVSGGVTTLIKTIQLNRNSNTAERLNLTGLSIYELNSTTPLNYTFMYNNFNQLPSYLSFAVDHWGYYNGTPFNTTNNTNHYAEREPNIDYLQIGSLTRIIYPTKGYTDFEYERHDYSRYVNANLQLVAENSIAGGLRVKKITTYDGVNQTVKEIKYVNDLTSNVSSGILSLKNKYLYDAWEHYTTDGAWYRESNFSINSLIPESNFSGSHIGYSKVYELTTPSNGRTVYEYTDYQQYPDTPYVNTLSQQQSIYSPHNKKDFKRGLEKSVSYYDEFNTTTPVKKIENTYNYIGGTVRSSRGTNGYRFRPCFSIGDEVVVGNAYEIEYSDFKLTSSTVTENFGSNAMSQTTSYLYTEGNINYGDAFLYQQMISGSNGDYTYMNYNYPYNYFGTAETEMVNKHFFPVIETSISGSNVSKTKNIFTMVTLSSGTFPLITSTQKLKETGNYETDLVIDKYDIDGNILQYHKEDGTANPFYTSYIWSKNLLTVKIEGAPWVDYPTGTDFTTFNSNLDRRATKYTYNAFRDLETITFPNGIFEKYVYDINHRLEKIVDVNNKVIKKFEYNIK